MKRTILNSVLYTLVTALALGIGYPLIVTGLALNDVTTILRGAIPSALLALALHAGFEGLDRVAIPVGFCLFFGAIAWRFLLGPMGLMGDLDTQESVIGLMARRFWPMAKL